MSGNLTDKGFVAGYNAPITKEIYDKLGTSTHMLIKIALLINKT